MNERNKTQESQNHNPAHPETQRRDAFRMPFLFRLLLGVMLVLSFVFFATKLMEYNRLKQATEGVNEEIREHESNVDELKYLIDSPVDDAYIIRVAREKLGLVFPDEEIFYNDFLPQK